MGAKQGNGNHMKSPVIMGHSDSQPEVKLEDVILGKNYQFAGDRYRVRKVVLIEGEWVTTETIGDTSDHRFYKVHYSLLKPNKTPLSYLQ